MNKKYKILGIIVALFIIIIISLQFTKTRNTEIISINEIEKISTAKSNREMKMSIPKNAILIKENNFKREKYANVYSVYNGRNTKIYLVFIYPVLVTEPTFTLIQKEDKKIIINARNSSARGGLMQPSYYTYEIEIDGEVNEVILKESNK